MPHRRNAKMTAIQLPRWLNRLVHFSGDLQSGFARQIALQKYLSLFRNSTAARRTALLTVLTRTPFFGRPR